MPPPARYIPVIPTITALQYDGSNQQDFIDWLGDDFDAPLGGCQATGPTGLHFGGGTASAWADQDIPVGTWLYKSSDADWPLAIDPISFANGWQLQP